MLLLLVVVIPAPLVVAGAAVVVKAKEATTGARIAAGCCCRRHHHPDDEDCSNHLPREKRNEKDRERQSKSSVAVCLRQSDEGNRGADAGHCRFTHHRLLPTGRAVKANELLSIHLVRLSPSPRAERVKG